MRVAITGYPLLSPRQWNLCEEFADRGVQTHIIAPPRWPGIATADHPPDESSFEVHTQPAIFNGRIGMYLLRGVGNTIREIKPDVVLTHAEPWNFLAAQMQLHCELKSIPHILFSWENLERVPTSYFQRFLEGILLGRINGIIAGSKAAESRLLHRGIDCPRTVAPQSGVNTTEFTPGASNTDLLPDFDMPANRTLVTYAGRFVYEKGLDTLLDAVPLVVERCPETHFLLIGEGDLTGWLEDRVSQEPVLNDHVTIVTEFQPYGDMPGILRSADIVVYPSVTVESWAEQFGYVVAEAMACSTPVVTTNSGSLPYVVGDAGLTGPEKDPETLADNISTLAANSKYRERLGQAARKRVQSEFSIDQVAETQLAFLRKFGEDST